MEPASELRQIAKELRTVAALGLNFAQNAYDVERYEQILAASARITAVLEQRPPDEVLSQLKNNFFQVGPLAGGEAAVFHNDKLLLIRRGDDGLWALPGGITDAGETLAQSALRELREEAGIDGDVGQFLGIFDSRLWHSQTKIHFYHAIFLVEAKEYTSKPGPEVTDAAYFAEDQLPPLSPGHHLRIPFVFKQLRGDAAIPYFDPIVEEAHQ